MQNIKVDSQKLSKFIRLAPSKTSEKQEIMRELEYLLYQISKDNTKLSSSLE